ncbi:hypothetical protein DZC18_002242 [Clostridium beijerinckii]|nr:hypothetical protein [Clostridium beijerinckii]NSA87699.1 hypothetical protein [Clostridium beijerinckii]
MVKSSVSLSFSSTIVLAKSSSYLSSVSSLTFFLKSSAASSAVSPLVSSSVILPLSKSTV